MPYSRTSVKPNYLVLSRSRLGQQERSMVARVRAPRAALMWWESMSPQERGHHIEQMFREHLKGMESPEGKAATEDSDSEG